jgi:hypothetical protein
MRGAAPQSVPVHTGLTDGTVTEIVDGEVAEGDLAVVDATSADSPPPAPAPAGTTTSFRRLF